MNRDWDSKVRVGKPALTLALSPKRGNGGTASSYSMDIVANPAAGNFTERRWNGRFTNGGAALLKALSLTPALFKFPVFSADNLKEN